MRYEAPVIRMNCQGVDLKTAIDALGPGRYRILTNVVPTIEQSLVSRPGTERVNASALGSAGVHSLGYLNAPSSTSRLIAGAGSGIYDVNSGALLASGMSGLPLSLTTYRLSGSGSPWMIVGDSSKLLKISPSEQVYQLGIAPPSAAVSTSAGAPYTLTIQSFNTDSGFDYVVGGGVPAVTHGAVPGVVGDAIQMGTVTSSEIGFFGIVEPLAINLNSFGSGDPAIQDTDYISLWFNINDPTLIEEVRILFDLQTGLGFNENYYMASARTSDIQQALDYQTTVTDVTVGASSNIRTQEMLENLPSSAELPYQPGSLLSEQISPGQSQWTNIQFTRGSFQRIGSNTALNWSNVQAISVIIVTSDQAPGTSVTALVNQLQVSGGYGINGTLGTAYDWRATYQNSVTLSESNPSPIQATSAFINAKTSPVTVTVSRSSDAQVDTIRFWRRGGTLGDNWYLVGTAANPASGSASFVDGSADASIASEAILSITNDQPFTTLGSNGQTLLGTPLGSIFGPYNGDILFGVADPNNPGFCYWTNAGNADAAAAIQNVEVSSPSDGLMNGCIWDNQPFVATPSTWYRMVPSQIGAPNQFQGLPTGAQHGLMSGAKWAFVPTPAGIAYVSNDGVYIMANGPETPLAAIDLWPIFNGVTTETYAPIDVTHPEKVRMAFFDSEVWFGYQDTAGAQNWWTYHIFKRDGWKHRQYPWNPAVVYTEPDVAAQTLLLGGNNGVVYNQSYALTADDGSPIACHLRTASFNFGETHSEKEFGGVIVDANTGAASVALACLFGYESSTVALGNVVNAARAPTPFALSDVYSTDCVLDFAWSSTALVELTAATLLWRRDATPVVHFEDQPEGFTSPGYGYFYDGYITLRSTASVTLTLEVDGVTMPAVTIPSTNGIRLKNYVQCPLNKGKVFRRYLNSSAPFRVYAEDTFLNFGYWNGGMTQPVQMLAGIA